MNINVSCQGAAMRGRLISIYIAKRDNSFCMASAAADEAVLLEEKQGHLALMPWSSQSGEVMERRRVRTGAFRSIALAVMFGAAWGAKAQDTKIPYPSMAPLEQYLMPDRNEEIKLARSAAPDSISGDAEVLVLGRHGYETA